MHKFKRMTMSSAGETNHKIELINPEKYRLIAKRRIISNWKIVMVLAHIIHMQASLLVLFPRREVDHTYIYRLQGLATLLLWLSLTKYLISSLDYSTFPKTIVASTSVVFNGVLGILPAAIGIAFFTTVNLYSIFRHKTFGEAFFTMFYTMNGDTMFDAMFEAHQVSPAFMLFYILIWLNLAIYIINKLALAMVEDGYLT